MQTQEHIQTTQQFLAAADSEFDAGDILQASEKLWGAAAHVMMAVAQERGWSFGDHRALKNAVRWLAEEQGNRSLIGEFGVAEKFHANFYHAFMQDYEIRDDRETVQNFVQRVQGLLEQGQS